MKWKTIVKMLNLLLVAMYILSLLNGELVFMQNMPWIIQMLPLIVALVIEGACSDDRKEK